MKRLLLLMTILITSLSAQEFEALREMKLESVEDYKNYEPKVLEAIEWILQTPVEVEKEKRQKVNMFFLTWAAGTQNVSIDLDTDLFDIYKENKGLSMIFMAGWTKYALESEDYNNKLRGNLNGILAVIDFYNKNIKELGTDKAIEKYIKMKKENRLEEYIKEYLSKK